MKKFLFGCLLLASVSVSSPALAAPQGGEVRAGSVTIDPSGATTIRQLTDRAIVDWRSFSLDANELVRFVQPSELAVILNRVTGSDPSLILGKLQANGQVFLVNPNGILFGPGSRVDVGGLLATTLSITDQDFLAGDYSFRQDPAFDLASVVNQGTLRVSDGGYLILSAPMVSNEGLIVANLGRVSLGAGGAMTVNLDGRNLVNFEIDALEADGTVGLTPSAVSEVFSQVVNRGGIVTAGTMTEQEGEIRLEGGAGTLVHTGTIRAARTDLDSTDVTVASGAAEAHDILVFSDKNVIMDGSLRSDGGFVEISGHENILLTGTVRVPGGTLLIDPLDLTIVSSVTGPNQVLASLINGQLNSDTEVHLVADDPGTGNGSIVQNEDATLLKSAGTGTNLILEAGGPQGGVSLLGDIRSTAGPLHVTLLAGASGTVSVSANSEIDTNTGDFAAQGGAYSALGSTIAAGTVDIMVDGQVLLGSVQTTSLSVTSANDRVLQAVGSQLEAGTLLVDTPGNDVLNNVGNDIASLVVTGGGAFSLTEVDSITLGASSIPGGDLLISAGGVIELGGDVVAADVGLVSQAGITNALGSVVTAQGLVNMLAADSIGSGSDPILLAGTPSALTLSTTNPGAGIHLQHDTDLTTLVVATNDGTVSIADRAGGPVGQETLSLSGGLLNGAANAGTNLTFTDNGSDSITLGTLNYPGGSLSLITNGSFLDDGVNSTRVAGNQLFLTASGAIGTAANAVDVMVTALNAQALGGDLAVADYTGSFSVAATASDTATFRALGGDLLVQSVLATTASFVASGAITGSDDGMAEVYATQLFLNAGTTIDIETSSGRLQATAGGNLTVDNLVTDNTAIGGLNSTGGSVLFIQESPSFTVATVQTASAAGSLTLTNTNGNLTVLSSSSSGHTALTATGRVWVANSTAPTLDVTGHSIQETAADQTTDLVAGTLNLNVQTAIAGGGNVLEIDADSLSVSSALGGNIELLNMTGDLNVSSATSGSGSLRIGNLNGDLSVSSVDSGGSVRLETQLGGDVLLGVGSAATAFEVLSAGKINPIGANPQAEIIAADAMLTAVKGIGTTTSVDTDVSGSVTAQVTGNGRLWIDGVDGLQVLHASTNSGHVRLLAEGGGHLTVTYANAGGSFNASLLSQGGGDILTGSVDAADNTLSVNSSGGIAELVADASNNFSAAIINLTAVDGIAAIEVDATTLTAVAGQDISLTDLAGGVAAQNVRTTGGSITLEAQQGDLNVNTATTMGTGDITLSSTGSGAVRVHNALALGHAIEVTSAGIIRELGSDAAADLTATEVRLLSQSAIGAGDRLELSTGTLTASAVNGNLVVGEVVNGMTVTSAIASNGVVDILVTNGALNVEEAHAGGANGSVLLETSAGDIRLSNVVAVGGGVTVNSSGSILERNMDGSTDLTAAGDVFLRATNGTISTNAANALEVLLVDHTVSVLAGGQVGGVSVRVNGQIVPTHTLEVLTPFPPGTVFYNGTQVYP